MVKYETLILVDPTLSEEEVTKYAHKLESFINAHKGKVVMNENLGRKKLAYPVRKKKEGSYLRLEFDMPTPMLSEYERDLRLEANVLRQMTIRLEK